MILPPLKDHLWGDKFKTLKKIQKYFKHDETISLLCGRLLKDLVLHTNSNQGKPRLRVTKFNSSRKLLC